MITELSRLSQLTENKLTLLAKTLADSGFQFSAITDEIRTVIKGMDAVTAGKASVWYFEANAFAGELAAKQNVSIEIAAGIISAVSPRMPWLRNKRVADTILGEFRKYGNLSAIDAAKEIGMALSANVALAVRIARGEDIANVLTGIKRQSFYNNIVSPNNGDSVTVDTWMINSIVRAYGVSKKDAEKFIRANEKAMGGTGVGYFLIAESVRNVATEMGMHAHQIQSLYWVALSGDHNGGRTDVS